MGLLVRRWLGLAVAAWVALGAAQGAGMWGSPAPPPAPGISIASVAHLNRLIRFGDASGTHDGRARVSYRWVVCLTTLAHILCVSPRPCLAMCITCPCPALARSQTFVFTGNEWSQPVVAPREMVTSAAVWVDGDGVYAHGGRQTGCDEDSADTLHMFNASTLMWTQIEVTPTAEARAAVAADNTWSIARSEHCAVPRPGSPWLVVLFGGRAQLLDHYWVIDTRNWSASVFPLEPSSDFVGVPPDRPTAQRSQHCLMSGDLLYFTAAMEQATNYSAMRNLGAFNLTSGQEVLPAAAAPGVSDNGAVLQVGADGGFVQLNATSLLAISGCASWFEVLCQTPSQHAWIVHGLDDPSTLAWEEVPVSWGSAVPALMIASAAFR